jgi:hypothetical protein
MAGDDGWSCPEEGCAWKFCLGLEIPQEGSRISHSLNPVNAKKKQGLSVNINLWT